MLYYLFYHPLSFIFKFYSDSFPKLALIFPIETNNHLLSPIMPTFTASPSSPPNSWLTVVHLLLAAIQQKHSPLSLWLSLIDTSWLLYYPRTSSCCPHSLSSVFPHTLSLSPVYLLLCGPLEPVPLRLLSPRSSSFLTLCPLSEELTHPLDSVKLVC